MCPVRLQSTVSLFVQQGNEAVAITMVEPTTASHHLAFRPDVRRAADKVGRLLRRQAGATPEA